MARKRDRERGGEEGRKWEVLKEEAKGGSGWSRGGECRDTRYEYDSHELERKNSTMNWIGRGRIAWSLCGVGGEVYPGILMYKIMPCASICLCGVLL